MRTNGPVMGSPYRWGVTKIRADLDLRVRLRANGPSTHPGVDSVVLHLAVGQNQWYHFGRCTTHFSLFWLGLGCSLGLRDFDPWPFSCPKPALVLGVVFLIDPKATRWRG